MNLNWRDPSKELPKPGQTVWILTVHKDHEPGGFQISCGEYEEAIGGAHKRVVNNDGLGMGSLSWNFIGDKQHPETDEIIAWLPFEEIDITKFLKL